LRQDEKEAVAEHHTSQGSVHNCFYVAMSELV
jgi:hypothetical protein